eukprot:7087524-Prymnesium_polylepis.1
MPGTDGTCFPRAALSPYVVVMRVACGSRKSRFWVTPPSKAAASFDHAGVLLARVTAYAPEGPD